MLPLEFGCLWINDRGLDWMGVLVYLWIVVHHSWIFLLIKCRNCPLPGNRWGGSGGRRQDEEPFNGSINLTHSQSELISTHPTKELNKLLNSILFSGGKSLLGVSKAKRPDTLESTWKTITDGRAVPLTRHLRKSDTWERDNHHHHSSHHQQQQLEKTPQKMTKAETFKDRTNAASPLSTPSPGGGGLGKLKKEPSLGQDELNKRVEAFIKKFNEEMRLQRQESLNQYMEMINRGSH